MASLLNANALASSKQESHGLLKMFSGLLFYLCGNKRLCIAEPRAVQCINMS